MNPARLRPAPRRLRLAWLLVTLLCVLLSGLITQRAWLWRLDMQLYDVMLTAAPRAAPEDVLIVAIDDRSLAELGAWPWPRDVHARLLDRLGEARAVAFDVIFSEPGAQEDADLRLAQAIARQGAVLLPVFHAQYAEGSDGLYLPIPELARAAAGLGHIHVELDPDGIARSVYLWEGLNAPRYPHLALATLMQADPVRGEAHALHAAHASGPGWYRDRWTHVPFLGPPGTFRYLSYTDVLNGRIDPDTFRDAVVFVGANAQGLGDTLATPTTGHARLMPGVEVHATLFTALRAGQTLHVPPPIYAAVLGMFLVALLMVALWRLPARLGLLATALMIGLLLGIVWLGLKGFGVWLAPAGGLLALLLAYPLWSWRRLEVAQHYLDRELARLSAALPPRPWRGDHFAERIARLQGLAEQQHRLRQNRDDTLYFLSHDLRSPLTTILTLLQADNPAPGERDERLGKIRRYAHAALEMVDNLREQARAENVNPLNFDLLSLELLIEEAIDEVYDRANAKRITLRIEDESGDDESKDAPGALVRGDPALLHRALVNVLGNAVKYTGEGGHIRVRLQREVTDWVIEVEDNGIGIAPDKLSRLFQRLSRIEDGRQAEPGLGLGLLMVLTVLQRHGGEVGVRSEFGMGSCFSLRLPSAAPESRS